jgi:hypothetical protein
VKSAELVNPSKPTSDSQPATGDDAASETQRPVKRKIIKRGSSEFLRLFDEEGNEYQDPDFRVRQRAVREAMEMEDLTQKSSMSLTQENPPSAYDQFDIQKIIRDEFPSTATPDDNRDAREILRAPNDSLHSRQQTSTRTESTAQTYQENDPRYIKLDFDPAPPGAEDEDENVDTSFAAPRIEPQNRHSFEPQTPAAPINPFGRKGSVLKPSQMFGATQASSIGRHLTSPTSSRPSPDVYNDFSSPPKRQRLASSPLAGRAEDTSPLQSSVRNILARSLSTDFLPAAVLRTSGVQSFDTSPQIQRTENVHEPRPYLSMQESQERRSKGIRGESDTDSDGSDSSIEARPRKRKMEREQLIRQELSTVGRMPSSSSRPASATSAVVEVPSTGRRRSRQEDYIAQCAGWDARDTQQDDIIADSQTAPDQDETSELQEGDVPSNIMEPSPEAADARSGSRTLHSRVSQDQPAHLEPQISAVPSNASLLPLLQQLEPLEEVVNASESTANALPEPSLPLQELSSNRSNLRTPIANKNQIFSDGSETVPETSPLEERLRPMGEIANISFGGDADDEMMANLPGFTQDVEFDNAMRMRSSPQPPPRATANRKDPAPGPDEVTVTPSEVAAGRLDRPLTGLENPVLDASTNPEQAASVKKIGDECDIQAPFHHPEQRVANDQEIQQDRNPIPANNMEKSKPMRNMENLQNVAENDGHLLRPASTGRSGLRSKSELKGPSQALRRSGSNSRRNTPSRVPKQASAAKTSGLRAAKHSLGLSSTNSDSTGITLPSLPAKETAKAPSSTKSLRREPTVQSIDKESTPVPLAGKRTSKRKSGVTVVGDNEPVALTRSSNRHSTARGSEEDSEDPLTLAGPSTTQLTKSNPSNGLFQNMAFAVSYVKHEQEKNDVTRLIMENGGQILPDGFEVLFEKSRPQESDIRLSLSAMAKPLIFSALIADDHSRKAKYMQALALGLPCISGRWISACVTKGAILDWAPYLLCAGQSSFLGKAIKSRTLQPYSAADTTLETIIEGRDKLLNGKSVLMVMGKGKSADDKRKAYVFLTHALGPDRVGQVMDLPEARKKLTASESEGQPWDLLYVDNKEEAAATAVFGSVRNSNGSSRKRKRGSTATEDSSTPSPKRIRVISDETMIQSLILGQFLED